MPGLVFLPPEILSRILSFLTTNDSLAPYAAICKLWQAIIEKETFSTLYLTERRLREFHRIVSPSKRRRSLVRQLDYIVSLLEYGSTERGKRETDHHRELNNCVFTGAIQYLFEILNSWPDENECVRSLKICALSPSDRGGKRGGSLWESREFRRYDFLDEDLLDQRWKHSYLQVIEPFDYLPSVNVIVDLQVDGGDVTRRIAPAAISKIVSRLPRLRRTSCFFSDNEKEDNTLRDALRNDFATSLAEWPQSIRHMELDYYASSPSDQACSLPVRSKPGTDALSPALCHLTQGAEKVELKGVMIAPELFWSSDVSTPPQWPNLTSFELAYSQTTPCGQWLFERDPRLPTCFPEFSPESSPEPDTEFDDDLDRTEDLLEFLVPVAQNSRRSFFRSKPAHILNDLYLAAGRAAQQMPRLQIMILQAEMDAMIDGLENVIPPTNVHPIHWFIYKPAEGWVTWASSGAFRIDRKVLDVWETAAKKHGHSQLEVENLGFSRTVDPWEYEAHRSDARWRKENGCHSWDT